MIVNQYSSANVYYCGRSLSETNEPTIKVKPLSAEKYQLHAQFMDKAIEAARSAEAKGHHPFGAVLVYKNPQTKERSIVMIAENTVSNEIRDLEHNCLSHAETNLVRQADIDEVSRDILLNSTLYTSGEPCTMCCGALPRKKISKIVYSAPHNSFGTGDFNVPSEEIFKFSDLPTGPVKIIGPIKSEETVPMLENWCRNRVKK